MDKRVKHLSLCHIMMNIMMNIMYHTPSVKYPKTACVCACVNYPHVRCVVHGRNSLVLSFAWAAVQILYSTRIHFVCKLLLCTADGLNWRKLEKRAATVLFVVGDVFSGLTLSMFPTVVVSNTNCFILS